MVYNMLRITTAQGGNVDRNPPRKPKWRTQSMSGDVSRLGKNFGKNRVYRMTPRRIGSADCLGEALAVCAGECGEAIITSGDVPWYDVDCLSCLESELSTECLASLFGL